MGNFMGNISMVLTGGFLKGYRTKILAALLGLNWIFAWFTGDMGLVEVLKQNWIEIAVAMGLYTAADHDN